MRNESWRWAAAGLSIAFVVTACSGASAPGAGPGGTGVDTHDGGLCTDTWEDYGQTFFTTTCVSCHEHDHSAFMTQPGVAAEASLIITNVSSGAMPKDSVLSEAERHRVLIFAACGAPSVSATAGFDFEAVSARAAVAKVKNILAGLPPTDEEVAAVEANQAALPQLIDGWMQLPEYQQKMKVFFELAFQQTQITGASFVDLIPPNGLGNSAAVPMLVQNIRESFARTVLALNAEGKGLTDAFTTHRFMMTPALMELYAFLDARHADDNGKIIDEWARANSTARMVVQLDGGAVPIEQTVDSNSPNFLHFYDPDLAKLMYPDPACATDPQVLAPVSSMQVHDMLYGEVGAHKTGGIACPPRGGSLGATQLTAADFTTWKMVTIRPPVGVERPTLFFDLPALRAASELIIRTPHPGYFTTPAFFANWPTNQSNQMRVTVNQALIVATGMQFDGLDATASPATPGLDAVHAASSACYACHRLLDPTRSIFSSTYSWFYNQQVDPNLVKERGLFQFQGVTARVANLDDFARTLATHPAVATAWAQKVCEYANSAPCAPNDPELKRVAASFAAQGFSWSVLIRELMSSPMITNLAPTVTNRAQGEVIAVTRRDHLCAALNARLHLNDVCGLRLVLGAKSGSGSVPQIVTGMPSDGYGRGATAPVLPNDPTLFYRSGLENICVNVANLLIDAPVKADQPNATHWSSMQADVAISDFVTTVTGMAPNDPRASQVTAVLRSHYSEAQKTESKTNALRSTFVTACLAPTFTGIGL